MIDVEFLKIFLTTNRKCLILITLNKSNNYEMYYSLDPFDEISIVCTKFFEVSPINIKNSKIYYMSENKVECFYIPQRKDSDFLNNIKFIDYNTTLHDVYKNLNLFVSTHKGGNTIFVNQEKLNIPPHFIVTDCYFINTKEIIVFVFSRAR